MARTTIYLLAIVASAALVHSSEPAAEPEGEEKKGRPSLKEYKEEQAAGAAAEKEELGDQKKQAAVNKVIEMLEDVQHQVIEEGEEEAKTYDKFACFCRTQTNEKTRAIKKGRDEKESLEAHLEALKEHRKELDTKIVELNKALEKAAKDMERLQKESDEAFAVYEKNKADLDQALYGLTEAIRVMKASKQEAADAMSLVQMQSISKTVNHALMLADALGINYEKNVGQIFLQGAQAPEVEMENYKFHSGGVINTLEALYENFEHTLNEVDREEVQRVHEFDSEKQHNTDMQKALNQELDDTKDAKDKCMEDIAESSQELTTVSAQLADDIEYLQELSHGCSQKAKTWDQRSKVRVQELTAITEAVDIVKAVVLDKTSSSTIRFVQLPDSSLLKTPEAIANDDEAMEAIEAEAEGSAPVGFLQRRMLNVVSAKKHAPSSDIAKDMIVSLLKTKGSQLKSTLLLSVAAQVGSDPFAKVKKLIQELIERLLTEAANEANQKGWCDKAMADAKMKRDGASSKTDDLNAEMATLEARRDTLAEELQVLTDEVAELDAAQNQATKMRDEEKAENKQAVYEATVGLDATNMAIKILSRFYKTAAKAEVDLSLSQTSPWDEAPETSFKTGEAYKGAQGDSKGIVGMLEVIQSDFKRTIKETAEAEKAAQKEYDNFMTESSKSLAEKKVATEEKTKYLDETNEKLDNANQNLQTQTDILVTSIKELMELQKTCIDTGMTYAERVAMREEEIAALKKASCILVAYATYGPDGLKDQC